jgi:phage tail protein X
MLGLVALLVSARDTAAFPHVVKDGETVAQLAEAMYGRVEVEQVIVAANALDGRRGSALVPGMRLELPAVGYHKVLPGDAWGSIATELLGGAHRADVLAHVNGTHSWLPPAVGREIVVPYNLRYVANRGDTTESIAYRFLGRRGEAWVVASYNRLRRAELRQGEVVLVPLSDLALTDQGQRAALTAGALVRSEGGGAALRAQSEAEAEIPRLVQDVRRGRYVEAVARGATLLNGEGLSEPQLAVVHRQLTEAYVALDANGLAATACAKWRQYEPTAVLDPIDLSPKIMRVCVGEAELDPTTGIVTEAPDEVAPSASPGEGP